MVFIKWLKRNKNAKAKAKSKIKQVAKANGTTLDLTGLGLTSNDFEALFPLIVQELPNLRRLDLKNNKLTAVPNGIWDLTNLMTLNLDNNELDALSTRVGALTELFSLGLSGNHLTTLPNELENLLKLKELRVANNQLSVFPDSLRNLGQLKYVHANNNQLTSIEPILGSPELVGLYAAQNKLRDLPNDLAKFIPAVRTLELEDNLFPEDMEVPTVASVRVENIRPILQQASENDATALQLCNCFLTDDIIEKLIPLIAAHLPNLEELYLNGNQLRNVPSIESLTKLKVLDVGANIFSCITGNPNFPETLEQIRGTEVSWWPPLFDDATATNNFVASFGRPTTTPPVSPPPRRDEHLGSLGTSQVRSPRGVRLGV